MTTSDLRTEIRAAQVRALRITRPELYDLLERAVQLGQTEADIMQRVDKYLTTSPLVKSGISATIEHLQQLHRRCPECGGQLRQDDSCVTCRTDAGR